MAIINTNALALTAQNNLSRTQSQTTVLSSQSIKQRSSLDLEALIAAQKERAEAEASSSARVAAAQQTGYKAQTNENALSNVSAVLDRVTTLVSNAANGNLSATDLETLNKDLASLKGNLKGTVQTTVNGDNWLNETASSPASRTIVTSASGTTTTLGAVGATMASDVNANNGVLTKGYEGANGNSYHLLGSAAAQGSREISVSATTTKAEYDDMLTALNGMKEGISSARTNLNTVASGNFSSSNKEVINSAKNAQSLDFRGIDQSELDKVRELATRAKEQLEASRLSIVNAGSILTLFR